MRVLKNLKCKKFRHDQISSHFEYSRRKFRQIFVQNLITRKFFVVYMYTIGFVIFLEIFLENGRQPSSNFAPAIAIYHTKELFVQYFSEHPVADRK